MRVNNSERGNNDWTRFRNNETPAIAEFDWEDEMFLRFTSSIFKKNRGPRNNQTPLVCKNISDNISTLIKIYLTLYLVLLSKNNQI